jgi:cell division protein FtsA
MIREKYYCGFDLGSRKVKTGILKIKDIHQMELVGVCEKKTYGFKNAFVSDLGELSECVHGVLQTLSGTTGIKLKELHLGVGGDLVEVRQTSTVIPLIDRGNKIITKNDIRKVNEHARLLSLKMEEEVMHDVPQHYMIDDGNMAMNPRGLYGRKLGVHSLMIIAYNNRIRNIVRAINQVGYDVPHVFFSSYAASEAAVTDEQKERGCVLVDVGAKTTSVLMFKDKFLRHMEKIGMGGNDLTESIARKLNLSFDLADEIKKSYASVEGADRYHEEEILVKRESAYAPVKRREIHHAIAADTHVLVEKISSAIKASRFSGQMEQGIIVVGAGALLAGFIERLGQTTALPVRLGTVHVVSWKESGSAASFAAAVGLAKGGFKKSFGYTISSDGHVHWMRGVAGRVRELYQEYF